MGQKTNPTALRLGKIREWEVRHFEKKPTESFYYSLKEIEIQKFAEKFFNNYGLQIQKCKVFLNERTLQIFISYYAVEKSYQLISELTSNQKIKLFTKNKITTNFIKKKSNTKNFYQFWAYLQKLKKVKTKRRFSRFLRFNTKLKNNYKIIRNTNLEFYKKTHSDFFNTSTSYNNKFINKFTETLNKYLNLNKYFTVSLTCKQINKSLLSNLNKKNNKFIKRVVSQLRRYQNNSYYTDGLNLLFQCIKNKQSHKLIAEYIARELGKLKRHSLFFRFVTAALTLFYRQDFSEMYGIKIQIKGRINGNPRSKKKLISVGRSIQNQSLLNNVNYYESTAFTKNGSFGVKTWVSEKT